MMPLWLADIPMPVIVLIMKATGIVLLMKAAQIALMMNWSMKTYDSCR
jgi:hypothetical protein